MITSKLFAELRVFANMAGLNRDHIGELTNMILRHGSTAQETIWKKDREPVQKAKSQQPAKARPPTVPANQIQVNVGPYGTEVQAAQEAKQYLHPNVFMYRSAIFPNPVNYRVNPVVKIAKPIMLSHLRKALNPWVVQLTIDVQGLDAQAKDWIGAFRNRIRGIEVTP